MAFKVMRGTNISHWLSQSSRLGEPRRRFFLQEDVQRIAHWGFDHIRLPIDEQQMWNDAGQPEPEAWDLMEQAIDWSLAEGLNVIVDLHILRSHHFIHSVEPTLFTDPAEAQRFAGLWQQLSQRLSRRSPDRVAYELMNEAVAADPEDWNRVANIAFAAVRRLEPGRTIILGSNRWNQCHTFDVLRIPGDRLQILTFHFYNPMLVTHYKATWWEGGIYEGPVHYPGLQVQPEDVAQLQGEVLRVVQKDNRPYDRAAMLADMHKPLQVQQKTGLPLYCGEFGCLNTCPDSVRFPWYRDLISLFKEHQIAWANWDYKGGFGLVDHAGQSTGVAEVMLGV